MKVVLTQIEGNTIDFSVFFFRSLPIIISKCFFFLKNLEFQMVFVDDDMLGSAYRDCLPAEVGSRIGNSKSK